MERSKYILLACAELSSRMHSSSAFWVLIWFFYTYMEA